VKNEKFYPPGRPRSQGTSRDNRKNRTGDEEKILRRLSETSRRLLEFCPQQTADGKAKTPLYPPPLPTIPKTLAAAAVRKGSKARALSYRVTDPDTLYRIAVLQMKEANYQLPFVPVDGEFVNRPSYLEGRFTDDADLNRYTNHTGGRKWIRN
jgi:hypothetical protein